MPPRIEEEFWRDTTDVKHFEMLGSAKIMQFSRLNDFLLELLAFEGEEEVVSLELEVWSFCGLQLVNRISRTASGYVVFGDFFVGFGILCSSSTPASRTEAVNKCRKISSVLLFVNKVKNFEH